MRHLVDRIAAVPAPLGAVVAVLRSAGRSRHPLGTTAAAYRRGGRDPARFATAKPRRCEGRDAGGIDRATIASTSQRSPRSRGAAPTRSSI
ncbi:hypothetical protein [Sphingomonas sp. BK345]|uniref:hypothetical protein n=1 Tax=Sphingomonas sp. BK345 TaxID=2586980 RepID=UPI001615BC36|nr:hypothetical protein [Sphingomonas sp. BK345]MBB3475567.1 hypothetical protein [Sphingomonas sp. BK345]